MTRKRTWPVLTVISIFLLVVSALPIFELPFAGRISFLDFAFGILSGGEFSVARITVILAIIGSALVLAGGVVKIFKS